MHLQPVISRTAEPMRCVDAAKQPEGFIKLTYEDAVPLAVPTRQHLCISARRWFRRRQWLCLASMYAYFCTFTVSYFISWIKPLSSWNEPCLHNVRHKAWVHRPDSVLRLIRPVVSTIVCSVGLQQALCSQSAQYWVIPHVYTVKTRCRIAAPEWFDQRSRHLPARHRVLAAVLKSVSRLKPKSRKNYLAVGNVVWQSQTAVFHTAWWVLVTTVVSNDGQLWSRVQRISDSRWWVLCWWRCWWWRQTFPHRDVTHVCLHTHAHRHWHIQTRIHAVALGRGI